jgi:hypothetical protein
MFLDFRLLSGSDNCVHLEHVNLKSLTYMNLSLISGALDYLRLACLLRENASGVASSLPLMILLGVKASQLALKLALWRNLVHFVGGVWRADTALHYLNNRTL